MQVERENNIAAVKNRPDQRNRPLAFALEGTSCDELVGELDSNNLMEKLTMSVSYRQKPSQASLEE